MNDNWRPYFHFSPPQNWLNDPNGLVYFNGEYHLFYQYHPDSDVWGPMHWGHAVTRDLVNWQHLPIALYPDEHGMIFSGSAVIDQNNTSGFGKDSLVTVFTHHKDDIQSQSVAYSNDAGRVWKTYSGNPVLLTPDNTPDFRDPKVVWYGTPENGHWVMCLAVRDKISFYTSPDLLHWGHGSDFGSNQGSTAGVWETPELFELPVDGGNKTRWVLVVGVQAGSPAGGSGTQYFIGTFDGKIFTSENSAETVLWADYGADFYAAQSWNNEPNGRRLLIAWMNNWDYARLIPSNGTRGVFSLIREVSLKQTKQGIRLFHRPIPELQLLRSKHFHWEDVSILPNTNLLRGIQGHLLEVIAEFKINSNVDCFGLRVHVGLNEHTSVIYNVKEQQLHVDRSHSGTVDFQDSFAAVHVAPLSPVDDTIRLHIFVDRTSIEVFANDGVITFTESIFPSEESQGLEIFTEGGEILLKSLNIFKLNSTTFSSGGN